MSSKREKKKRMFLPFEKKRTCALLSLRDWAKEVERRRNLSTTRGNPLDSIAPKGKLKTEKKN